MESVLKFLPGGRQIADAMSGVDPKHFARMEAIVLSMTPKERENPDLIDFSRKKRIARPRGIYRLNCDCGDIVSFAFVSPLAALFS